MVGDEPTRFGTLGVTPERAWQETLEQLEVERWMAVWEVTCDVFPGGKVLSKAFGLGVPTTVPDAPGKRTG